MTRIPDLLGLTWWGFVLLYLLAGWIIAGLLVWFRQPLTNTRMIVCLLAWPLALGAFLIAALVVAAHWVFSPDTGPIAMVAGLIQAAGSRSQTSAQPPPASDVRV